MEPSSFRYRDFERQFYSKGTGESTLQVVGIMTLESKWMVTQEQQCPLEMHCPPTASLQEQWKRWGRQWEAQLTCVCSYGEGDIGDIVQVRIYLLGKKEGT